ncbi:P-loop containing nucleoside triphosphate hydrolase protein, partial [Mycena rebaudengoi]
MKLPTALTNLIQYTSLAATTAADLAGPTHVPFLASIATLTSSILKCLESIGSNKDEWAGILEQIHEVLCTILKLYATSEDNGGFPTALHYDIAKFAETLQMILTFLITQQKMGKIKRLLTQAGNASRLEMCKQKLNYSQELFKVRAAGSTIRQVAEMRKDAKQQHEELVSLLRSTSDLRSDHSSVIGSLSSLGHSSGSFSMFPPYPHIFHGRDAALQHIVNILIQDSAQVAILGMGGIGKTSLAIAVLHDTEVATKYPHQYFVPCHSTPTYVEWISTIADHIGLERGSNLEKRIILHLMHGLPCLLVLDNLETPWEPVSSRYKVEEFLSLLTDIPHLGLMITLRGTERPAKVKWTRPFLSPLGPLSDSAAHETFFDIADGTHDKNHVKQLLSLTGNLPLAVSLIASVAAHEGCASALARWNSESTRMLSDGYDQRSSLDTSIMLSFTSSRMTTGAQELLNILSMLPDGITDTDLIQIQLPINDILSCKTTLIRTSLAYVDETQRLKVLVPIREHVINLHPPTAVLKLKLQQWCH